MMRGRDVVQRWSAIHLVLLSWCGVLVIIAFAHPGTDSEVRQEPVGYQVPAAADVPIGRRGPVALPGGRKRVFDGHFLVAYYGTAGSGALGVLGDARPDVIWPRLVRAGEPFATPHRRVQPVFELIVNVARSSPGPEGGYSTPIPRAEVRRYIRAAHRHGALVVLDIQPGRSGFLTLAKRWTWALKDPWVGLALDPEWRVGPGQAPGRVIGHVRAAEVNRVGAWLSGLAARHDLPQKVFMVHQFRSSMIRNIERIRARPHLALVQHIDGFGTQREKLAAYHALARPRQFREGFKLFYRQDTHRMSARQVLRIRPAVRFVSFQ